MTNEHTSYLSFILHRQDFWIQNFSPANYENTKTPKIAKHASYCVQSGQFYTWQNLLYGHCPWRLRQIWGMKATKIFVYSKFFFFGSFSFVVPGKTFGFPLQLIQAISLREEDKRDKMDAKPFIFLNFWVQGNTWKLQIQIQIQIQIQNRKQGRCNLSFVYKNINPKQAHLHQTANSISYAPKCP